MADSGRSIFLEQSFEQRGKNGHFRWEIPYQCLVRIEEKPDSGLSANAAAVRPKPASRPAAHVAAKADNKPQGSALTAAASVGDVLPVERSSKTA